MVKELKGRWIGLWSGIACLPWSRRSSFYSVPEDLQKSPPAQLLGIWSSKRTRTRGEMKCFRHERGKYLLGRNWTAPDYLLVRIYSKDL
jgi:hypothetical protein